jgi:hypothetical protein
LLSNFKKGLWVRPENKYFSFNSLGKLPKIPMAYAEKHRPLDERFSFAP